MHKCLVGSIILIIDINDVCIMYINGQWLEHNSTSRRHFEGIQYIDTVQKKQSYDTKIKQRRLRAIFF